MEVPKWMQLQQSNHLNHVEMTTIWLVVVRVSVCTHMYPFQWWTICSVYIIEKQGENNTGIDDTYTAFYQD